ncbi:MAG: 3-hydroxyacyl-CoA dehydrogenase [Flavobacteriales bacterium]|nr:3-hydroxyacyl-CoA dehydrogenase [Flavobacteriales bacterium]|tara:strand:+ start:752 stop:3136 length:2385 start_codon:yes stop_codon:yes gene_type:complete
MRKKINNVAVIGSGIMGSRIACHFANIGVKVLLLDIPYEEKDSIKNNNGQSVRNKIVNTSLNDTLKAKPSAIYSKLFASRIKTGNLSDDISKISEVDWIIEVIIENLEIKKNLFQNIEKYRTPGTIISSNTSGIPINKLIEGRTDDFCQFFCGTHFFNPPRYLKLLEIIPSKKTDPELVSFLMSYGEKFLGKTTVLCKDTPAFIANRIGIAGIATLFKLSYELDMTITDIDALTGPIIGRPKSATFRTSDLVGLDTLNSVAEGVYNNCPNDEHKDIFKLPPFIKKMLENKWLGDKTKQGFYKKDRDSKGNRKILSLDLNSYEYKVQKKTKFETIEKAKKINKLKNRLPELIKGQDKAAQFYKKMFAFMFAYVANRIPEITNDIYKIDDAMCAGFGWEMGPFALWESIGIEQGIQLIESENLNQPAWTKILNNTKSFYKIENGEKTYLNINKNSQCKIPTLNKFIILDNLRTKSLIWKNQGLSLIDIGDGVLNIEFHTKLNSLGKDVIEGVQKGIEIGEKEFKGIVIGNQGEHFSAGADISMIFTLIVEQEWEKLNLAIKTFQNTSMLIRYSNIPVVVAPHGLTLGGGCEFTLHADSVQCAAETYMGLVELGVGLIPGGGGTKEMALRASDLYYQGDVELPRLKEYFLNIGQAKVATSAHEAFDLGYLQKGKDNITINTNKLIEDAKQKVLLLDNLGYTKPIKRNDIKVLGQEGMGMFLVGADTFREGGYITEHEQLMCEKLAYVLCGGNLSSSTKVSEQYLLDIEREAFLSLCGESKTLERIKHMLEKGKPLRN